MLQILLVLFWCCGHIIRADGERGAAERTLLFYSYMLEGIMIPEITDKPPAYTIAPKCEGSAKGGRCTFGELMAYLWHPAEAKDEKPGQPGSARPAQTETDRPDGDKISINNDDFSLNKVFKNIGGYGKGALTGSIDVERAVGEANYYLALPKFGTPLRTLNPSDQKFQKSKDKRQAIKFQERGRSAAQLVVHLRQKDMERYRLRELSKPRYIGVQPATRLVNPEPEMKTFTVCWDCLPRCGSEDKLTVAQKNSVIPYHTLDPLTTLKNNPGLSEDNLNAGLQKYIDDDPDHHRALESAKEALRNCQCA